MRHAFDHHHPDDRARDAEARAILRDPHALVVVDEAMDTYARQQMVALGLDQRFGREPRRQADEFVPGQAPKTLRGAVGVAEQRIGLDTVHQQRRRCVVGIAARIGAQVPADHRPITNRGRVDVVALTLRPTIFANSSVF
jgi:hypothetical protein